VSPQFSSTNESWNNYRIPFRQAPSRPSKHNGREHLDVPRREVPPSPIKPRYNESSSPAGLASSLMSVFPTSSAARKLAPPAATKNASPLALPMPAVLRQPEEQTDNWDDDFEEGISFSKLQGIPHRYTSRMFHLIGSLSSQRSKSRRRTKNGSNPSRTTMQRRSDLPTVLLAQHPT
jgi:hypothetical protein